MSKKNVNSATCDALENMFAIDPATNRQQAGKAVDDSIISTIRTKHFQM